MSGKNNQQKDLRSFFSNNGKSEGGMKQDASPPPSKKAKVTAEIIDAKPSATASTSTINNSSTSNPKKSKSSDKSSKAAAETKLKDTSITIKDTSLEDIKRELDILKDALKDSRAINLESEKKNGIKVYTETFDFVEREGVAELVADDHRTIKRRVERSLSIIVNNKNDAMVGVSYTGLFPTGGNAGNKDTISMLNPDRTTTLIRLVTGNEVVAKYVTESRALFLKKDGSTPDGKKDYHLTFLSDGFMAQKNLRTLEETVNGLIQKAEKDGKIPIIAVALHPPVSQPSAHESEERIIKTVQDLGYLSTEGTTYKAGNSSDKTPYAQSWLVIGIGIVPALEEGRLFFSLGGTTCFQNSMMKRLKVAHDRKKWAVPKKATSKKPASYDLSNFGFGS